MPFIKAKCPNCGKVAESLREFSIGTKTVSQLKCGHIINSSQLEVRDASTIISMDNRKLFKFQEEGVRFIEQSGFRCLVGDEMGLGKTIQILAALALHPEQCPVLMIGKATLGTQYQHEIFRWTGQMAQIIDGGKCFILPGLKFYIVSYDMVRRIVPQLGKLILEQGIKTIVLDECQQIKNPTAQRTVEVRDLTRKVPHVVALSGTPIKNNAGEYFPVLNILKPEIFPKLSTFQWQWCESYHNGYSLTVGALKDPALFSDRTKDFIIRRERKDVMPDLPLISRNWQFCELGEEVTKAYRKAMMDLEEELESTSTSGMEKQANILAYISKMRHLTGLSKIGPAVDFVLDFLLETDRKITIFVHHKDVGEFLKNRLEKELGAGDFGASNAQTQRMKVLQLTSDLNPDQRAEVVRQFMDGAPRILIASTLASGEGLNLQKCSDCIMLERQWNPSNEEQAEGRFIRIGQTAQAVTATYFIATGTVDEFFTEIVERKREIVANSLNGEGASETWDQTSLIRELTDTLMSKGMSRWRL